MSLSAFTYNFPFLNRFSSAISSFFHRNGLIMSIEDENISYWVEASPLEGFSRENLSDVKEWLSHYHAHIPDLLSDSSGWLQLTEELENLAAPASLQHGIEMFWLSNEAYDSGLPVHKWLNQHSAQQLDVNKIEGLQDLEALLDSSDELRLDNAKVFKIKTSINPLMIFERLELIAKIRPDLKFRIDPNGSWSVNEAITYLEELQNSDLTVEYCEQPIESGNIEGLNHIRSQTTIPIAVDEDAADYNSLKEIIDHKAADIIIVKPMRFGSIYKLRQLLKDASSKGFGIVFTTLLEAAPGRLQTAHLASALGSPDRAHGMDTGTLFEMDLWDDRKHFMSSSESFTFDLPDQPGLGYPLPRDWQNKLNRLSL